MIQNLLKFFLSCFFLLSICTNGFGQKIFYDSLWNKSTEQEASYYRLVDTLEESDFMVHDFYLSDSLQMIGRFSALEKEVEEGKFVWFYEEGDTMRIRHYTQGIQTGKFEYRFQNGVIKASGDYKNGERDGEWRYQNDKGQLELSRTYSNGKLDGLETNYKDNGTVEKTFYKDGEFGGYAVVEDTATNKVLAKISLDDEKKNGFINIDMKKGDMNYVALLKIENRKLSGTVKGTDLIKGVTVEGRIEGSHRVGVWRAHDRNNKLLFEEKFTKKSKKSKIDIPFKELLR